MSPIIYLWGLLAFLFIFSHKDEKKTFAEVRIDTNEHIDRLRKSIHPEFCSHISDCPWRVMKNGKDIFARGPQIPPIDPTSRYGHGMVDTFTTHAYKKACDNPNGKVYVLKFGSELFALVGGDFSKDNDIDTSETSVKNECRCKYGGKNALCHIHAPSRAQYNYGPMFWIPMSGSKISDQIDDYRGLIQVGPDKNTFIHYFGYMFDTQNKSGLNTNKQFLHIKRSCSQALKVFGSFSEMKKQPFKELKKYKFTALKPSKSKCNEIFAGRTPQIRQKWRLASLDALKYYDKNDDGSIELAELFDQAIARGIQRDWLKLTLKTTPCLLYNAFVHASAYHKYLSKLQILYEAGADMAMWGTNTTITLADQHNSTKCYNHIWRTINEYE